MDGSHRSGLRLVGGVAMFVACTAPAGAQDAARMEAIERQIRALQQELQQLRSEAQQRDAEARAARAEAAQARAEAQEAQHRLENLPPPATSPVAAAKPAGSDVVVSLEKGRPTIGTADKRIEASLGTQTQFDIGGWIAGPSTSGENLRRGRLFFGFKYDDLQFNITPDFGGSPDGTVRLYEANLNWSPTLQAVSGKPLTTTIGYFKPWITLQDSMSSNDFLFFERPSIVEISRNIAAGDARASLGAKYSQDRWFASAYATGNSYGQSSSGSSSRSQIATVLRAAGRPIANEDWDLHLGLSGSYVFATTFTGGSGQQVRLRDFPEVRLDSRRLIDTGNLPVDTAYTVGPELGLRWRNFLVQGEYIQIGLEQSGSRPDLTFPGAYVEGSWVITGEPRKYNASAGAFTRPSPKNPVRFTGDGSGWGAWELSLRYSYVDLEDHRNSGDGAAGGEQQVAGLALSWYPMDWLRFALQGDYVDVNHPVGISNDHTDFYTVALRTQVAF